MLTIKFENYLQKQLRDPTYAAAFMNAALKDDNPQEFLSSLKSVILANGGVAKIAKKSGISRQHLYRIINGASNPTIQLLMAVLKTLKINLAFNHKTSKKKMCSL